MSFSQNLVAHNLSYMNSEHVFKKIVPCNTERFAKLIKHIVSNNLSVYIDPDCDPDGYFSAKIIQIMFDTIGYPNYIIGHHEKKRHIVPIAHINYILNTGIDVIILLDSSTNSLDLLQHISSRNVLCAVIDHHVPDNNLEVYPENTIIINPCIDSLYHPVIYDKLSAGAICALVVDFVLQTEFDITVSNDIYLYGVITLYSDVCDLSNTYNIAYIQRYQNTENISSQLVKLFWTEYSYFDRSYISFRLVPRLNSLMRNENFDLLHKLFFNDNLVDFSKVSKDIEDVYLSCKERVEYLTTACELKQYDHFAVIYMGGNLVPSDRNFTGLLANKIANDISQPCLCLYPTNETYYGGSVRDPFGRDLLSVFKPICTAAGHASAFGINLRKIVLPSMISTLCSVKNLFVSINQNAIIQNWDTYNSTDDIIADLQLMAQYNEFGGQGLPKAIGFIKVSPDFKIYRQKTFTAIYGRGLKFICFTTAVDVGDALVVTPTLKGQDYSLIVNNVSYLGKTN